MASTTVRVSEHTHELLRKLADATGEPLAKVLERAVENYRREQFFASSMPPTPGSRPTRSPGRRSSPSLDRPGAASSEVRPPDGGLREVSCAMCEQVRSLAVDRLGPQPFGSVPPVVLRSVEDRLRFPLDL
jgi:hypothetical protein